jgi:hypothetical protein
VMSVRSAVSYPLLRLSTFEGIEVTMIAAYLCRWPYRRL